MAEERIRLNPDSKEKSSTKLSPKNAIMISHIGFLVGLGWLSGLIIYKLEKENSFVKFHAMQSIVIGIAEIVAYITAVILTIMVFGIFLVPLIWMTALVIRIIILVKANDGEHYKFPWFARFL